MSALPEFSRPVLLARLGSETLRREISAGAAERAALARRFDLVSLDRLSAVVDLVRQGGGGGDLVLLRATFDAAFVQQCVVTLDPVAGAVSEEFALLYGPPEAEETAAGLVGDAVAFEPLVGEAIDIGEAVAQEFSLALPPFPRSAAADAEAAAAAAANEGGPFAGLGQLLERRGRRRGGRER
jgi:uncharacterized metal-binding protein YceD (DUF177 family)